MRQVISRLQKKFDEVHGDLPQQSIGADCANAPSATGYHAPCSYICGGNHTEWQQQRIEFCSGFRIAKLKKEKGLVAINHLTLYESGAAGRN